MSFNAFKRANRSNIIRPIQQELERAPRQFCDFMSEQTTRFNEICCMYLEGMTLDDVMFMKPEDLIELVPPEQYRHRLLMTIMVRRYLFRPEECETICCKPPRCDTYSDIDSCGDRGGTEYRCDSCNHVCRNSDCDHKCSDYTRINVR